MICKIVPPNIDLHPKAYKGWQLACSNHGNVVRSKHAYHIPKSGIPKPGYPTIWITSPARWRRAWLGEFAKRWKWIFDDGDRAWWNEQAASIAFTNEKNVTTTRTGFQLYMWYQFRWLTMRMDRYIPFPVHATDFAFEFTPPWEPPELEAPTIISAVAPGTVRVRCLNTTPEELTLLPLCWWKVPPTIKPVWTPGHHPWYWFDADVDDDHTIYSYYINPLFPKIRQGTQATLVHCYGNIPGEPTEAGPLYPALGEDDGGADTPWNNPMDALTINYIRASLYTPDVQIYTNRLLATDFSFDIPTENTILGIRLRIYPWTSNTTVWDTAVHLLKGGVEAGQNKAILTPWPKNTTYPHVYGSETDLWEADWTPDDINDPNFGASLRARLGPDYTTAQVDAFQITVWHTFAPQWFTIPTQLPFTFT